LAVACAGPDGSATRGGTTTSKPVELAQAPESPRENGPSAIDDPQARGLPKPLVDTERIISGGPPPDGIPAIDDPRFERAGEVDWLKPSEPVLSLMLGAETRAYPVQVLIWHEIVTTRSPGRRSR